MADLTTGKVYKVWIEIEEYDIKRGDGETVHCLSTGSTATFRTIEEAEALAKQINEVFGDAPGQVTHT